MSVFVPAFSFATDKFRLGSASSLLCLGSCERFGLHRDTAARDSRGWRLAALERLPRCRIGCRLGALAYSASVSRTLTGRGVSLGITERGVIASRGSA